jgi:hypothetical protein
MAVFSQRSCAGKAGEETGDGRRVSGAKEICFWMSATVGIRSITNAKIRVIAGHFIHHFGVLVDSLEELQATVARAKARQARDPRVSIIDVKSRRTSGPTHDFTLTSAYIGFVLPLMVELQHLVRHEPAPA